MLARFLVMLNSFLVVLGLYLAYGWVIVPLVLPVVEIKERPLARTGLNDQREKYLSLFPKDAWERTSEQFKMVRTGEAVVFFQTREQLPDNKIKVSPCTILQLAGGESMPEEERLRQSIMIRTLDYAVLEFDRSIEGDKIKLAKVQRGELAGIVTITSDMKEPGPEDDLRVVTEQVVLTEKPRITTISTMKKVDFKLASYQGRGDVLTIELVYANPRKPTGPKELNKIQLLNLDELTLGVDAATEGLFASAAPQAKIAGDADEKKRRQRVELRGEDASVLHITCKQGFLLYPDPESPPRQAKRWIAQFLDDVHVVRTRPNVKNALPDTIDCGELLIYLCPKDGATAGPKAASGSETAPDNANGMNMLGALEITHLLARWSEAKPADLGKPAKAAQFARIHSPSHDDFRAEGEQIRYDLHANRVEIKKKRPELPPVKLSAREGTLSVHAEEVTYQMGKDGEFGVLTGRGNGIMRGIVGGKDAPKKIACTWNALDVRSDKREKDQILITMNEKVGVDLETVGIMNADTALIWCIQRAPVPANPHRGENDADKAGETGRTELVPHRAQVYGNVHFKTREGTCDVKQMDAYFFDIEPDGTVRKSDAIPEFMQGKAEDRYPHTGGLAEFQSVGLQSAGLQSAEFRQRNGRETDRLSNATLRVASHAATLPGETSTAQPDIRLVQYQPLNDANRQPILPALPLHDTGGYGVGGHGVGGAGMTGPLSGDNAARSPLAVSNAVSDVVPLALTPQHVNDSHVTQHPVSTERGFLGTLNGGSQKSVFAVKGEQMHLRVRLAQGNVEKTRAVRPGETESRQQSSGAHEQGRDELASHELSSIELIRIIGDVKIEETMLDGNASQAITILGKEVYVWEPGSESMVLKIVGEASRSAIFRGQGIEMVGSNINLSRPANQIWVNGVGQLTADLGSEGRTDMPGSFFAAKPREKRTPAPTAALTAALTSTPGGTASGVEKPAGANEKLFVRWNKGMQFNGQVLLFEGQEDSLGEGVKIFSQNQRIFAESATVHLNRFFSFFDSDPNEEALSAETIECKGRKVWLVREEFDNLGKLESRDEAECVRLVVHVPTTEFELKGPGRLRRVFAESSGNRLDGFALPGRPNTPAQDRSVQDRSVQGRSVQGRSVQGRTNEQDDGGITLVDVTFYDRVVGNQVNKTATVSGQITCVYYPLNDWNEKADTDNLNEVARRGMSMKCNRLHVVQMFEPYSSIELTASENTRIEGNGYYAKAESIKYNQAKELVILEGSATVDAQLFKQEAPGSYSRIPARRIEYNLKNRTHSTSGLKGANIISF